MHKFWALPSESKFRDTGTDWLQNLLAQADEGTWPRILLLLWRAWHLRNDVIHQDGKARIDESVVFLQSYLVDNHLTVPAMQDLRGKAIVQAPVIRDTTAPNSPDPAWSPPPKGWVKVNTNGSFSDRDRSGGVGIIMRDRLGNCLSTSCVALMQCEDAEEVEDKAALEGIKIATNLGYTKIVLELDCSAVAKALRLREPDRSKQWNTYEEAKKNLKAFQDHMIILVKRDCNSCADSLAKHARTSGVSFLADTIPHFVRELVTKDNFSGFPS
ncbi:hypothetical protein ACQ4PT_005102 [Festuca glaucescens]